MCQHAISATSGHLGVHRHATNSHLSICYARIMWKYMHAMEIGVIKRVGFRKVNSAGFVRASNEEKGHKLYQSSHVFDVTEESIDGQQYSERAMRARGQGKPGSICRHHRG